ncbi:MAG TPA: hypothetical protein VGM80_04630 [Gaiellaceae bacterium]
MDVAFEVAGTTYLVPEPQATILAENLRILAKSELAAAGQQPASLIGRDADWRPSAEALADEIEHALVDGSPVPLRLEGGSADATYCVLRLMVGADTDAAAGLRDALGTPVAARRGVRALALVRPGGPGLLTRPELLELLVILFVLAVVTIIAGIEWTGTWYVLAPVIAALLGLRVATTRTSGRFAWTFASVLWFTAFLAPAAVLVTLVGLLIVAIIK